MDLRNGSSPIWSWRSSADLLSLRQPTHFSRIDWARVDRHVTTVALKKNDTSLRAVDGRNKRGGRTGDNRQIYPEFLQHESHLCSVRMFASKCDQRGHA